MLAGAVLNGLEQREDLLLAQNPFRECVLELGPPDGGPNVERQIYAVFALTSSAEARRGLYVDGRLREERGAGFRRALSARAAGQWQGSGRATCSATWASAKKSSSSADRKKSGFAQRRSNLNEGKRSTEDRKSTAAMGGADEP